MRVNEAPHDRFTLQILHFRARQLALLDGFYFTSSPYPFHRLVFSKLFYCCNIWSNTPEYNLNRIEAVQNFAARIISNTRKYDHVSPVLKDLE